MSRTRLWTAHELAILRTVQPLRHRPNTPDKVVPEFVLPETKCLYPIAPELLGGLVITPAVALDLYSPETGISRRQVPALPAAVPKTGVCEHRDLGIGKE